MDIWIGRWTNKERSMDK